MLLAPAEPRSRCPLREASPEPVSHRREDDRRNPRLRCSGAGITLANSGGFWSLRHSGMYGSRGSRRP